MRSARMNHPWKHAVPVLALLVATLSPAYAIQPTSGVSFAQISFSGASASENYSHYGQVSIDDAMLYGGGYVNVERYENGQAVGWVVKNLPVVHGTSQPGAAMQFGLGASG